MKIVQICTNLIECNEVNQYVHRIHFKLIKTYIKGELNATNENLK